jgi:hypothetical protein
LLKLDNRLRSQFADLNESLRRFTRKPPQHSAEIFRMLRMN